MRLAFYAIAGADHGESQNGHAQFAKMLVHKPFLIALHDGPVLIRQIPQFLQFGKTHLPCGLYRVCRMGDLENQIISTCQLSASDWTRYRFLAWRTMDADIVAAAAGFHFFRVIHGDRVDDRIFMTEAVLVHPLLKGFHQRMISSAVFARSPHVKNRGGRYFFLCRAHVKLQLNSSHPASTSTPAEMVPRIKRIFKNFFK